MCEKSENTTSNPLTLSAADSPVRTLATPESERVSMASEAGCGLNSIESFASYDRESRSWRTSQRCLDGEWEEFSETWPRAGMMRSGQSFRRVRWVRHTCGKGCSLLPTPRTTRGFTNPTVRKARNDCLTTRVIGKAILGMRPRVEFIEWMQGLPIGWTEVEHSEIASCHKLRNGSGKE